MKACIFPGQGCQFIGMGKELYETNKHAKNLFEYANEILGFRITDIMFYGNKNILQQTKITQLSIYIYCIIKFKTMNFFPDMVAGHSLGELSALYTAGSISFKDGIYLVAQRALIMDEICKKKPSGMAVILGLNDKIVEKICKNTKGIVVIAAYNCPGQIVISGEQKALKISCNELKKKGAKKIINLQVSGAFHSPIMEEACHKLKLILNSIKLKEPKIQFYQNSISNKTFNISNIKNNIINQLINPVRWSLLIQQMIKDGAYEFIEIAPQKILSNIVKKINNNIKILTL